MAACSGLAGGIWLGLRRGGAQPIGKALGRAGIALLAIVALAAGGLALYYYSIPHRLEYDQAGASLEFELRAPAGFVLPDDPYKIEVTLDTDLNQQPAIWLDPALRQEGDRQVLAGTVELYYRTSSRLLRVPVSRRQGPHLPPRPRRQARPRGRLERLACGRISSACPASRRR